MNPTPHTSGTAAPPGLIATAHDLRRFAREVFGLHIDDRTEFSVEASLLMVPKEQRASAQLGTDAPLGPPTSYQVAFYSVTTGNLRSVTAAESFDDGVQLVRDMLGEPGDYVVEATWTSGVSGLEVRSPRGTVIARVEPGSAGFALCNGRSAKCLWCQR